MSNSQLFCQWKFHWKTFLHCQFLKTKISFTEHICSVDEIFKSEPPDLSRDIQTPFPVGTIEAYTHCCISRNKLWAKGNLEKSCQIWKLVFWNIFAPLMRFSNRSQTSAVIFRLHFQLKLTPTVTLTETSSKLR